VEPHSSASNPAEHVASLAHVVGEDSSLDMIELARHAVGVAFDGVDYVFNDGIHQRSDGSHLAAAPECLARSIDGAERPMAGGDEEALGHGEMEKADLVGDPVQPANEVGKDAEQTGLALIELLVVIGGNEQVARRGRKVGRRAQEVTGARIGQIEVEPQPAVRVVGDRPIDRELLSRAVCFQAAGKDEAWWSLGRGIENCAGSCRRAG
jgi:hypothetical protein